MIAALGVLICGTKSLLVPMRVTTGPHDGHGSRGAARERYHALGYA